MIRSGARRVLTLVALLALGSAAIAAALGLATGSGVARPIGVAYYAIGSVTALIGFALGSRGLFRAPPRRDLPPEPRSADEVRESYAVSALLMLVGVLLIVLGIAVDPNARLV